MKSNKPFPKPDEIAEELDVSPQVLLSWRSLGMPIIKLSKYIFIPRVKFFKWLEDQTESTGKSDKKSE